MKVVNQKKAKALKGDKSLSYQVITPDTVGSRRFLITLVEVRPGGSTPEHHHRTVESTYVILEGRGEILGGKGKKVVGPNTAVYWPAGSAHGIRNAGRTKLRYLSVHAPPYEIEELYRHFREEPVVTGG